ncbi:hypothetical protein PTKIN_Ptkin10aG0170900 [Pterospermum kingtungense]
MASSALNQKSNFHARSNSLPSRPHPLLPQIEENLCRLKFNEAASSSSSIGQKLSDLRDLYELVDSLLQLPLTQKSLAQQCNELLNGSVRLLDVCGVAKDALLQGKENAQELQSSLRRRRGDDAEFTIEAKKYLASRKKAKKLMNKSLRDLKSQCNLDNDVEATFSLLRGQKTRKFSNMSTGNAQIELQKLVSSIQDLEDGVECVLRLLIKTRVSLLNILSH